MGSIYHKIDYQFPEGDITLFWDEGDKDEFGYEIEVTFYPPKGAPETIVHHSFGYDAFSEETWKRWGTYIHQQLVHAQNASNPEDMLQGLLEELNIIDCEYMLLHPDHYVDGKIKPEAVRDHLVDYEQISSIVEDMEPVDIRALK